MKRILLLCLLAAFMASCGSSRQSSKTVVIEKSSKNVSGKKVNKIVSHAKGFVGTRYKFGGTTRKGMDCSGLVYISFQQENITLPRISREMATRGTRITLGQVSEGDLVFFKTNKNRKVINHVGLVVESKRGIVKFIHSTSSRGVIISSLDERYWNDAFVEVRRVI
jgi:cell wall-associated NlpC family hydrolase